MVFCQPRRRPIPAVSQPPTHDTLPERNALDDWAARALQAAQTAGADGAEVQVSASRALTVSVRMGEVESVQFQRDRDLGLTVYCGRRSGSASTTDLSDAGIREAAAAAVAIARASGEDPCSGLPDASDLASAFPALDLWHPWLISAEAALDVARSCEGAGLAVDTRIKGSEGASVDTRHSRSLLANTLGFSGYRESGEHAMGCAVIASDDAGMQQGYWYSSHRRPSALEPAEAVGRRAGERAVAQLGARKLSTRRAPVLFAADVARSLFGSFCAAISGGALYRRSSFLLDRVGEAIFAPQVQLRQRPFLPQAAASAAFDQEGVATRDRELVTDGVLQGYLLGSYAARKLGLRSTGNAGGVFNLIVEPTAGDFAALVRELDTGLLVTELMGTGANLVTGDYSRGAAGFWVEHGEIAYPVQEITLAGTLPEMYRGIRAIGSDVDVRGGIRSGSVLIEGLMVGG